MEKFRTINNKTIIDGIDVSKCGNYDADQYFECEISSCHCGEIPNCHFKQLARAKSYEGLYLKNLSSDKIYIDKKVVNFMESLEVKNEKIDCSILTPSCGVKTLPELVEEHKLWNDFEEIIFCLDNDEAGNLAKDKLLELPHENKFRFFNGLAEGEDFEEFYKRVLVKELYR